MSDGQGVTHRFLCRHQEQEVLQSMNDSNGWFVVQRMDRIPRLVAPLRTSEAVQGNHYCAHCSFDDVGVTFWGEQSHQRLHIGLVD